jgi:hypothetical protein
MASVVHFDAAGAVGSFVALAVAVPHAEAELAASSASAIILGRYSVRPRGGHVASGILRLP